MQMKKEQVASIVIAIIFFLFIFTMTTFETRASYLYTGFFLGIVFAIMPSFFYFNIYRRIGMYRRMGRQYGIINFVIGKHQIIPSVQDLEHSTIQVGDKTFMIEHGMMYDSKEPKIKLDLTKTEIFKNTFTLGTPTIFLNPTNLRPMYLENDLGDGKTTTSPENIENILSMTRSTAKAKAIEQFQTSIDKYMKYILIMTFVLAVAAIVNIWFAYSTPALIRQLGDLINQLKPAIIKV